MPDLLPVCPCREDEPVLFRVSILIGVHIRKRRPGIFQECVLAGDPHDWLHAAGLTDKHILALDIRLLLFKLLVCTPQDTAVNVLEALLIFRFAVPKEEYLIALLPAWECVVACLSVKIQHFFSFPLSQFLIYDSMGSMGMGG